MKSNVSIPELTRKAELGASTRGNFGVPHVEETTTTKKNKPPPGEKV